MSIGFKCTLSDISSTPNDYENGLIVECDSGYAGTTITCTNGTDTYTEICPTQSPYKVMFPVTNGNWTVSGVFNNNTNSVVLPIYNQYHLYELPKGSEAIPINDVQTLLHCANIYNKSSITTISSLLSDSTTFNSVISSSNAVDYLVRCTGWTSNVTGNSTAMTNIGNNNNCSNKLLANSTWRTAICNSTYFEKVLNVKVPTMTSATAPSGKVTQKQSVSGEEGWRAFAASGNWRMNSTLPGWIQYQFTKNVKIYKMEIKNSAWDLPCNCILRASTDGTTFQNAKSFTNPKTQSTTCAYNVDTVRSGAYWRLQISSIYDVERKNIITDTSTYIGITIVQLQFYGRNA